MERTTSDEPDLEIFASPDDVEGYAVFGDWLCERNDPHGELIALQIAGASSDDLFQRHRQELLGPKLASLAAIGVLELEWRWGFVERAWIGRTFSNDEYFEVEGVEAFRELRARRVGRFLRHLMIGPLRREAVYADMTDAIVELGVPSTLKQMTIEAGATDADLGPLARLCPGLVNVRDLQLMGVRAELDQIALPNIERLEMRLRPLTRTHLAALGESHLPKMEELYLDFGWFPGTVDERIMPVIAEVRDFVDRVPTMFPSLRKLCLSATGHAHFDATETFEPSVSP